MTSPTERSGAGRRALVVGTGLIGGSIALGLRRHGWHVSGVDSDAARAQEALARGVIDTVGDDPDAEVVFVAVPAAAVAAEARRLLDDASRRTDVVVTDVSGVKAAIVAEADHPRFIGGHPMAGSEQIGLHGADAGLFEGATWVLTPTAATDLSAFDRLKGIVMSLGAEVLVLSPADHDRLVAVVSHVPHLVAATLMNAASAGAEQDGTLLRLAAGGFRDMTRVAAGHPGIWPDICVDNARSIIDALDALVADLQAMRARVASHDREALLETLRRASTARRSLPARIARPDHLAEVRIPVHDREGVLAEIGAVAAQAGVNIYDIEIAHSAEGASGILILIVDSADVEPLMDGLEAQGYRGSAAQLS
jgi:prephenate dehydrogenase